MKCVLRENEVTWDDKYTLIYSHEQSIIIIIIMNNITAITLIMEKNN